MRFTASSSTTSFAEVRRLARYLAVGGTAACVDLLLFLLLARVPGVAYQRAAVASFVVATWVNYLLGVRLLFVSGIRFRRGWELAMVFGVSLVGLLINQVALAAGVERLHLPLLVAKVFATGVVFFWNYGARRLFVFGATRG